MNAKPLMVAARYKLLLVVPFVLIIPIATVFSVMSIKKEYTSTARLFAQESVIADNLTSGNPYASPAENRASDMNELLATDKFKAGVAGRAGLPGGVSPSDGSGTSGSTSSSAAASGSTDPGGSAGASGFTADLQNSMWEIEAGTQIYASGRHLLIVSHTSPDPDRAKAIVNGLVEEFRAAYRANVAANADNALKVYQSNLDENSKKLDEAQNAANAYVAKRGTTESLTNDPQYATLQAAVQRAQKDYDNTQQNILQIQLQRDNSLSGQDYTLSVQDAANRPLLADVTSKKKLAALPIAGFLIALSLSAILYAFLFRTDNRIRTAEDLRELLPDVSLLGTVPEVTGTKKRSWPKHYFRIAVARLAVTTQR